MGQFLVGQAILSPHMIFSCASQLSPYLTWTILEDIYGSRNFPFHLYILSSALADYQYPYWVFCKAHCTRFFQVGQF